MKIADFVEKRFVGMTESEIEQEHEFSAYDRRLEHVAEGPEKEAAKTLLQNYRESYKRHLELTIESQVLLNIRELFTPKVLMNSNNYKNPTDNVSNNKNYIIPKSVYMEFIRVSYGCV